MFSRTVGGARSVVRELNSLHEDIVSQFDYQVFMELPEEQLGELHVARTLEIIEVRNVSYRYTSANMDVLKRMYR